VFAVRTRRLEQAALWLGAITPYEAHQHRLDRQTLPRLQTELEETLGHEQFESLLAAGKSLELSAVRDEVAALFKAAQI
jgi:hypothetical protein